MTWPTLKAARTATKIEFSDEGYKAHHFVRLPSGRWCRTLGAPGVRDPITGQPRKLKHVRGRVWHLLESAL